MIKRNNKNDEIRKEKYKNMTQRMVVAGYMLVIAAIVFDKWEIISSKFIVYAIVTNNLILISISFLIFYLFTMFIVFAFLEEKKDRRFKNIIKIEKYIYTLSLVGISYTAIMLGIYLLIQSKIFPNYSFFIYNILWFIGLGIYSLVAVSIAITRINTIKDIIRNEKKSKSIERGSSKSKQFFHAILEILVVIMLIYGYSVIGSYKAPSVVGVQKIMTKIFSIDQIFMSLSIIIVGIIMIVSGVSVLYQNFSPQNVNLILYFRIKKRLRKYLILLSIVAFFGFFIMIKLTSPPQLENQMAIGMSQETLILSIFCFLIFCIPIFPSAEWSKIKKIVSFSFILILINGIFLFLIQLFVLKGSNFYGFLILLPVFLGLSVIGFSLMLQFYDEINKKIGRLIEIIEHQIIKLVNVYVD